MIPTDVTLLVPFLAGTPDMREAMATLLSPPPAGLTRLLQRADRLPSTGADTDPSRLFDLSGEAGPAALSHLADTGRAATGYCLRADPVVLTPGRRGLLLAPPVGPLDDTTREGLEQVLAPLFADAGMSFELLANGRAYVRLSRPPAVRFSRRPPVPGEDITPLMPDGDEARDWRRLLNECQTRLHRPAFAPSEPRQVANSLFLWGGGVLPRPGSDGNGPSTWSDDPILRGAARLTGCPERPLPGDAVDWMQRIDDEARPHPRHLIHLPGLEASARVREYEDWARTLADYDERWFAPLVAAVGEGRIGELTVLSDGAAWRLRRSNLRRWWRRRPLSERLWR